MTVLRRLLVALCALGLGAGAAILVVEVLRVMFDQPPALVNWHEAYTEAKTLQWESARVRTIASAALAAGAVLVLIALWPRRHERLDGSSRLDLVEVDFHVDGLRRALHRAALQAPGVREASVTISPRRIRVRAVAGSAGEVADAEMASQLLDYLDQFALQPRPRLRTRTKTKVRQR